MSKLLNTTKGFMYPHLRPLRESLKVTQEQMAVRVGVTRVTYIKWENDSRMKDMPIGKYKQAFDYLSWLQEVRGVNFRNTHEESKYDMTADAEKGC